METSNFRPTCQAGADEMAEDTSEADSSHVVDT